MRERERSSPPRHAGKASPGPATSAKLQHGAHWWRKGGRGRQGQLTCKPSPFSLARGRKLAQGVPKSTACPQHPGGALKTSCCSAGTGQGDLPQPAAKPPAAQPPAQNYTARTLAAAGCGVPVPLPAQPQQAASAKSGLTSRLGRDIQVGKRHPESSPNFAAPCSLHKQTGMRGRLAFDSTAPENTLLLGSDFLIPSPKAESRLPNAQHHVQLVSPSSSSPFGFASFL